MIAGEADEREEGQMWHIGPRREWPKSVARYQIANEQDVREGEPEDREREPRHVDQRLFDRDEGEPPEQDEEHERSVNGTIVTEPVLGGRHVRGRFTSNKKLRASIAGLARQRLFKRLPRASMMRRLRSHKIHVRKVRRFGLEKIWRLSRRTESLTQFLLAAFKQFRVVRILDPHVVGRTHRGLAIQEADEVLPARRLSREHVRHLDGETPTDEERLPFVHVPLIQATFDELGHPFRV